MWLYLWVQGCELYAHVLTDMFIFMYLRIVLPTLDALSLFSTCMYAYLCTLNLNINMQNIAMGVSPLKRV